MSPSLAPLPCHNHAAMSYSVLICFDCFGISWVKDLSIILNGKGHSLGVSTCHSHAAKGSTWFHRFAIGTASAHVAAMVRALGLPISMRLRWPQLCQLCLLDPSGSTRSTWWIGRTLRIGREAHTGLGANLRAAFLDTS